MKRIERILYIRTDRMGDALMNLPAILALRRAFPKAWLTLMADRSTAGLFKAQPELDEVLEVDASELASSGRARRQLVRKVRRIHYDLAVVSNPSKFMHWLVFAAGIRVRAGWKRKWAFFLNRVLPDKKAGHEIDSNLSLVSQVCDVHGALQPRLTVDPDAKNTMKRKLDAAGTGACIAIHTGTSDPAKRWGEDKFIELCQQIERKDSLVFIGGPEEASVVAKIASKLSRPALDLCGKTSLRELAAFFADARVKALVSSDSGPVHVAWMSGKPVVAFYAQGTGSDPERWGPRDGRSQTIFKPMKDITPQEAFEKLEKVLS